MSTDVFVSLPKADVTIPNGIASSKTVPRMGAWSLELVGIIVEAIPIGIASDAFGMPRNDSLGGILRLPDTPAPRFPRSLLCGLIF